MSDHADISAVESRQGLIPRPGLCLAILAFSGAWLVDPIQTVEASSGARSVSRTLSVTSIVLAPMAAVTFAAPPMVTAPSQTVASFSINPLPEVASVVSVRLIERVITSRHGGRHGP